MNFGGEQDSAENPRQVRIQSSWSLTMTLEGGNNGANASVTIQVRKETTVKQILEDAAGQLGMGHEFSKNLCLVYPPDADIANAGEKIGVELTVEQANLFNHRPRLCKLNVITDEYVNRLVEKLKKA